MVEGGIAKQRWSVSDTAEYGRELRKVFSWIKPADSDYVEGSAAR